MAFVVNKMMQHVLAELIRHGEVKVTVENLDLDRLEEILHSSTNEFLNMAEPILYEEEMTDAEKVKALQALFPSR